MIDKRLPDLWKYSNISVKGFTYGVSKCRYVRQNIIPFSRNANMVWNVHLRVHSVQGLVWKILSPCLPKVGDSLQVLWLSPPSQNWPPRYKWRISKTSLLNPTHLINYGYFQYKVNFCHRILHSYNIQFSMFIT